ncbi:D-alanyl-D-alanine carboxypeptidase [Candidatus Parcubacteria bacterium]|nr:MAG: D-alanyl-D-alanine carboxypeptidase [Candidatus Parcubacteria bacterium]
MPEERLPLLRRTMLAILALGVTLTLSAIVAKSGPTAAEPSAAPNETANIGPALIRIAQSEPEHIRAHAVLITRLATGETLYEKNSRERMPIASITKLMTALLLAEAGDPLVQIPFSRDAKQAGAEDEKQSAVAAGDRLSVEEVMELLMAASDGDAAYAAAEFVGGIGPIAGDPTFRQRIDRFVYRMNERAAELGLADTHFTNPSGTDDPEHHSTAADVARLAGFIAEEHPEIWAASRVGESFVFGERGSRYGVVNTNPLFSSFPAIWGSKTGYEDVARGTLVMLYQLAPRDYIAIVLLRSEDRFADGEGLIRWIEENFRIED